MYPYKSNFAIISLKNSDNSNISTDTLKKSAFALIDVRYADMSDDLDVVIVAGGSNDFTHSWTPTGTIDSTSNVNFIQSLFYF